MNLNFQMGNHGSPTLPRTGLIWYVKAPSMTDSIGLSAAALWAALPATHRSIYFSDPLDYETKLDDATIIANIEASPYYNNGEELVGNATKKAQYQDGTAQSVILKAIKYFKSVWLAAYDPKKVLAVFDKINTEHVDFVGIGDSNQLKDAHGWDHGFQYALSLRYPMYSTGILTASENNKFGSGIGYGYSRGSEGMGDYTGAPASHSIYLDTATSGFSPHDYSYKADGTTETILSAKGMIVNADCKLDITAALKYRLYYGTFDFGSGSIRPAIRLGVSPFTTYAYQTKTTNTGANGMTYVDVSVAADVGRTQNINGLVTQGGYPVTGPAFTTYQCFINTDRPSGYSYNTMLAVGGWSAYDMALSLQSVNDATIIHFFTAVREKQSQATKNVVVVINSGLNDTAETELSIINDYDGDSAEAYQDNIQYIINRLSAVYPGSATELKFLLMPSHPISNPDNDELISYRTACRNICDSASNVAMLDITTRINADQMLAAGYYAASGTDKSHLVQAGYEGISNLLFVRN